MKHKLIILLALIFLGSCIYNTASRFPDEKFLQDYNRYREKYGDRDYNSNDFSKCPLKDDQKLILGPMISSWNYDFFKQKYIEYYQNMALYDKLIVHIAGFPAQISKQFEIDLEKHNRFDPWNNCFVGRKPITWR